MENRITVSICDEEYTFVAEEAPSYMQKVGTYVNDKMSELLNSAKVGRTDAAVLTAVNITDELFGDAATDYVRAGELDDRRITVEDRLMQLYEEQEGFSVADDMEE
jgi:cell division protein ZapA (FtsZ GTPase activity inhibitor)